MFSLPPTIIYTTPASPISHYASAVNAREHFSLHLVAHVTLAISQDRQIRRSIGSSDSWNGSDAIKYEMCRVHDRSRRSTLGTAIAEIFALCAMVSRWRAEGFRSCFSFEKFVG